MSESLKSQSVLMTVEELADRWGVEHRTIRSQIKAGRIKAPYRPTNQD
jgi:hypothetical protein